MKNINEIETAEAAALQQETAAKLKKEVAPKYMKWFAIAAAALLLMFGGAKLEKYLSTPKPPKPFEWPKVEVRLYLTNATYAIPNPVPKPSGTNQINGTIWNTNGTSWSATITTNGPAIVEEAGYVFEGQWRPLITRYNRAN